MCRLWITNPIRSWSPGLVRPAGAWNSCSSTTPVSGLAPASGTCAARSDRSGAWLKSEVEPAACFLPQPFTPNFRRKARRTQWPFLPLLMRHHAFLPLPGSAARNGGASEVRQPCLGEAGRYESVWEMVSCGIYCAAGGE